MIMMMIMMSQGLPQFMRKQVLDYVTTPAEWVMTSKFHLVKADFHDYNCLQAYPQPPPPPQEDKLALNAQWLPTCQRANVNTYE